MEVRLNPDLQAKLAQLASQRGRDTEELVVEAVERMVSYNEWFIREVEKGSAAADRGEFIEHSEVIRVYASDCFGGNREAIDAKIKRGINQLDRREGIPEDQLDAYLTNLKAKFSRHRHNS
jgi:predicted transcriptional regulator